jgi:hypothetical protein
MSLVYEVTYDASAALSEQSQQAIELFPNPTSNVIYLKVYSSYNFSILSSEGKSISNGLINKELAMDFSKLSNGIYFIVLKNDLETHEFKISKID